MVLLVLRFTNTVANQKTPPQPSPGGQASRLSTTGKMPVPLRENFPPLTGGSEGGRQVGIRDRIWEKDHLGTWARVNANS
jgi:hypothetical protein